MDLSNLQHFIDVVIHDFFTTFFFFSFVEQSIVESFLKDLPVHNTENFSLYSVDNARNMKRPSIYLPTVDIPSEQGI